MFFVWYAVENPKILSYRIRRFIAVKTDDGIINGNPVKGVSVTIKDKTTSKSGTTNASGQVTLPVKSTGGGSTGGGGGSSSGGGGGGWSRSYNTLNVKVTDKDGKTVSVSKSTGTDKVTLTLPTGKTLDNGNWYTITVTDRNGKAKADYTVVLKDRENNEVTGKTDKDGVIILPAVEHKAYIVGYEDGTFQPDGDMTRAEVVTVVNRATGRTPDKEYINDNLSTLDKFTDLKNNTHWAYYDIMEAANTHMAVSNSNTETWVK